MAAEGPGAQPRECLAVVPEDRLHPPRNSVSPAQDVGDDLSLKAEGEVRVIGVPDPAVLEELRELGLDGPVDDVRLGLPEAHGIHLHLYDVEGDDLREVRGGREFVEEPGLDNFDEASVVEAGQGEALEAWRQRLGEAVWHI